MNFAFRCSGVRVNSAYNRKGHDHNVSAYSRRSVNAWGVVNFASTVCTYYTRAVISLLAGPNPSEQKPNQSNKRLVCSYTAQRQQQKLGSCYFELFCNELSSIMTRMVSTHPRSRTLHLRLLHGPSLKPCASMGWRPL